jgi:hypothetical protein
MIRVHIVLPGVGSWPLGGGVLLHHSCCQLGEVSMCAFISCLGMSCMHIDQELVTCELRHVLHAY